MAAAFFEGYLKRYYSLFVFKQVGDIEEALLRKRNVYNGRIKSVEIVKEDSL
jgi:hypothetical protein